jgi:uncharacterized protein (TIGR02217 family)
MMVFDEVQFPPQMSYGSTVTLDFNNTILENSDGSEVRVCRWMYPLHTFTVKETLMSKIDTSTLAAFYVARQGPGRGFRFKDWSDYTTAPDGISAPTPFDMPMLPTSDPNVWQLIKNYTSGSITKTRYIYKPTIVVCAVGGTVIPGFDLSGDITRGLIKFASTPGTAPTAGCYFDVPVRFSKQMDPAMYLIRGTLGQGSIDSIELMEIKMLTSMAISTRFVPPPPLYVPPGDRGTTTTALTYSYDTTNVNGNDSDGSAPVSIVSGIQTIAIGRVPSTVTFNWNIDDLAMMIPVGTSVTATYSTPGSGGGVFTVTVPANTLFLLGNNGFCNQEMDISDGTRSAVITSGESPPQPEIAAGGFPVASSGTPIPYTVLESLGLADGGGNLNFILVLVPNGSGYLTITSASAT